MRFRKMSDCDGNMFYIICFSVGWLSGKCIVCLFVSQAGARTHTALDLCTETTGDDKRSSKRVEMW